MSTLDTIFEKEIMEEARAFYVKPLWTHTAGIEYSDLSIACVKALGIYGAGDYIIQALDDCIPRGINLATVRVRLSLTVEKIEPPSEVE